MRLHLDQLGNYDSDRQILFADTGCSVAPRCLECPLATCVEDLPGTTWHEAVRHEAVRKLLATGVSIKRTAELTHYTRRTVLRLKKAHAHAS